MVYSSALFCFFRDTVIKLLFVFFFISFNVCAIESGTDLAHPFYLLRPGQFSMSAQSGYFIEENEFDKAKVTQDLFEYDHFFYRLGSVFGVHGNRQVEINMEAQSNGTLYKRYSPGLNLPVQDVYYHGFHSVEVKLQQHFVTDSDKDGLMFQLKFKGSPLKGKETNNTYQGKDLALSLFWSHRHNQYRAYGEIHSEVLGKKIITQDNGDIETIDAYSQFGTMLGGQILNEKFWLEGIALFYLATDYNSRSRTYNRITDKGFVVGGKFLIGYYINPKTTLTIEHYRGGKNFNIVTESTTEATDYEIELQYSQLGVTWLF